MDRAQAGKAPGESVFSELTMVSRFPPKSCMVCTPDSLADALVQAVGEKSSGMWLDPCVGAGAFLRALSGLEIDPDRVIAIDIEETPQPTDTLARTLRGVDFLEWSHTTDYRFDRIVANPPYVALSRLPFALKQSALTVKTPDGNLVSPGSNYWYAFVCASLTLLQPGANVCFILPAAWDYANYAASLRESIAASFAHFETHRSCTPMFGPVRDGCVIIIGRGFGRVNTVTTRFEHSSVDTLISELGSGRSKSVVGTRESSARWALPDSSGGSTCRLGDVLSIRLGGVTGDAGYFLLTEAERIERGLPVRCVRPVLSKARHLVSGELGRRGWEMLRDNGERIWLFSPTPDTMDHPAVEAYLDLNVSDGGCQRDRYKIRNREPWYRTSMPGRVDGFMSGMSQLGPWICLRGMPRLNATNTLYTVRFRGLCSSDEKAAWALSLLTSYTRRALKTIGRVYPEGLLKFEPGDLSGLPVMIPLKVDGAREWYVQTIRVLLDSGVEQCSAMADRWFGTGIRTLYPVR